MRSIALLLLGLSLVLAHGGKDKRRNECFFGDKDHKWFLALDTLQKAPGDAPYHFKNEDSVFEFNLCGDMSQLVGGRNNSVLVKYTKNSDPIEAGRWFSKLEEGDEHKIIFKACPHPDGNHTRYPDNGNHTRPHPNGDHPRPSKGPSGKGSRSGKGKGPFPEPCETPLLEIQVTCGTSTLEMVRSEESDTLVIATSSLVCKEAQHPMDFRGRHGRRHHGKKWIIIGTSSAAGLIALAIIGCCIRRFRRNRALKQAAQYVQVPQSDIPMGYYPAVGSIQIPMTPIAPMMPMSDEQIARQLQMQYDAESRA